MSSGALRLLRGALLGGALALALMHASGVMPLRWLTQIDLAIDDARQRATLTGTRYCLVTTAVGGDPWAIEVQVDSSEVVDSAATLRAAMREKPAGANLTLTSSTPVTYDDLDTAYTTYSNMTASALTYTELRF